MSILTLGYALVGGVLPALIWLYFLLKEGARCREPRFLIVLAFLGGMLAVPLVLRPEMFACARFALSAGPSCAAGGATLATLGPKVVVAWAVIEETLKYLVVAAFILWRRQVSQAPDYVIYMLTVALGFAAAENMLFLLAPISAHQIFGPLGAIARDNLRFMGANLLHVFASSAIGFAMAFSRNASRVVRVLATACGLILAVALHALFNALIISNDGTETLAAFFLVWTVAIVFFALFEILKYFTYKDPRTITC